MSDLIDRQAAIDAILALTTFERARELYEYVQDERSREREWIGGILDAIDAVICLPTAEPKTERWISDRLVSTNGGTYGVRRCSECESYYIDSGYGWDFCPHCGARMEGEDNGDGQ